jgi:hypothetical protein
LLCALALSLLLLIITPIAPYWVSVKNKIIYLCESICIQLMTIINVKYNYWVTRLSDTLFKVSSA